MDKEHKTALNQIKLEVSKDVKIKRKQSKV